MKNIYLYCQKLLIVNKSSTEVLTLTSCKHHGIGIDEILTCSYDFESTVFFLIYVHS